MKRLHVIIVILAVLVQVTAFAQDHTLGVQWLGKTEERLKQGVSLSFSATAYDIHGTRESNIGGSYSAVTGYYPQIPRGTVLDLRVIARGFKKIERVWICIGESAGSKDSKDEKSGTWDYQGYRYKLCDRTSYPGEYSSIANTSFMQIRPVPIQWVIEHRDDRDKYKVAIFTFTWTRGGMMTGSLEINILRAPNGYETLLGTEIFPFLRGFMSIDSVPVNPVTSSVTPGKTASSHVGGTTESVHRNGKGESPIGEPIVPAEKSSNPNLGVAYVHHNAAPKFSIGVISDNELGEAVKGNLGGSEIVFQPKGWNVIYVFSPKPFEATIEFSDGRRLQLGDENHQAYRHQKGFYWVRTHGRLSLVDGYLDFRQMGKVTRFKIVRSKK